MNKSFDKSQLKSAGALINKETMRLATAVTGQRTEYAGEMEAREKRRSLYRRAIAIQQDQMVGYKQHLKTKYNTIVDQSTSITFNF